jgi:UMP-CMP kinase
MSFNTSEDVVTDTSLPEFIFMIGGPGAGKGTQCSLLAKKYGFFHFNLGNILRAETSIPGSKWGHIIRRNTLEGAVGSKEMTVDLLKTAINNVLAICNPKYILIDGQTTHSLGSGLSN